MTVLQKLQLMLISEVRAREHLAAGRVFVDGRQVTVADAPIVPTARVVLLDRRLSCTS